MDATEHLEHIRSETRSLADAAEGNLGQPVPSCPGWDVGKLVWHVYGLLHLVTTMASTQSTDIASYVRPDRPSDEELVAALLAAGGGAADTLSSLGPASPCWSWSDDHTVGFWLRRLPAELSIHAFDAAEAAGRPHDIDPQLAADGIDEYLGLFVPGRPGAADGEPVTVHLHATDAEGEWLVSMGGGAYSVERAHAKADVAIRGTASDLDLLLWGRRTAAAGDDRFELFGSGEAQADVLGRIQPG